MAIKQINTTISQSPEGKSIAKIREIRGKSLVWNQWCTQESSGWRINSYGTASWSDGVATITKTAIGLGGELSSLTVTANNQHKYYIATTCRSVTNNPSVVLGFHGNGGNVAGNTVFDTTSTTWTRLSGVVTPVANTDLLILRVGTSNTTNGSTGEFKDFICIDLTLMFGAGSEPETVEEFEAMFPENYYEYNSGEIINSNINAIEAVGFNQWDEEWEVGKFDTTTGSKTSASLTRSKNPIPVFPSKAYYLKAPVVCRIFEYDGAMNFIDSFTVAPSNAFTTSENCHYINFNTSSGDTYQNNICINLSDPSRNGTYEPYKKSTLPLNISTLTGKLNGEGESVIICSDGLKSAGSVYDYGIVENGYLTKIVKCLEVVDLGTLNWSGVEIPQGEGHIRFQAVLDNVARTSNYAVKTLLSPYGFHSSISPITPRFDDKGVGYYDGHLYLYDSAYNTVSTFQAAMVGVEMVYELATPEEYILDTPILMEYNTDGGTEQIVFSENLLSTLLVADIDYFNSAIKHIQFNEEKHCIRDERITGIDSTPTKNSSNIVTSGGIYDATKGFIKSNTYSYKCTAASEAQAYIYFLNIHPTSEFATPWWVHYTLSVEGNTTDNANAKYCKGEYDVLVGESGTTVTYAIFNRFYSTSYYPIYYHTFLKYDTEDKFNNKETYPVKAGVRVLSAWGSNTIGRTYTIKVIKTFNCTVDFPETIEVKGNVYSSSNYSEATVNATSIGLQESGDATDTSNIYMPYVMLTAGAGGIAPYSLIMQDKAGKWQSLFTGTTGTSASGKVMNTSGFVLGGPVYKANVTLPSGKANGAMSYDENEKTTTSVVMAFAPLVDFRYSFNSIVANGTIGTGLVPYKPMYIIGIVGSDGFFYLDNSSGNWWTQDIPEIENGKLYRKICEAVYPDYVDARCYRGDLLSNGNLFWYKDNAVRIYNPSSLGDKLTTEEIQNLLNLN